LYYREWYYIQREYQGHANTKLAKL